MKLLYFGDRHNRLTPPENRIDDFVQNVFLKDCEIRKIAKQNNVSALLQGGDFWESPNPSLDYASNIIKQWFNIDVFEILQKMTSRGNIEKEMALNELIKQASRGEIDNFNDFNKNLQKLYNDSDFKENIFEQLKDFVPMIGVAGNHELFGNNIKSLDKTMIGFMSKLGLIKFATKDNPYIFTTEDGLKVAITGSHYNLDIDSGKRIDDYIVNEKLGNFHIHIVHGYLSDRNLGPLIKHTTIDQISHTKADLTITGHDHIGFPITEVDGKYFVNTGGIIRLKNDLKEISRKPKVLLIDITKKNGLILKEIPLKCSKPGGDVLDRKSIESKKARDENIESFKKTIKNADINKSTDINEIIVSVADNKNLPPNIKDDVVNRVTEKISKMNITHNETVKDAYIDKVIIENFKTHNFTELEFSKGLNLFIGESYQGKSSVLGAMDWVYENYPRGTKFVSHGADYAKVSLFLSNGYIVSRYIETKTGGKNGYFIYDPKTKETEFYNTKILSQVQKLLGFSMFKIDNDLEFNLNFQRQGDSWFIISRQYSAPTKAKIIGSIYGTHYADAVARDLENDEDKLNKRHKELMAKLQVAESKIEKFNYLPDMKNRIDEIELSLNEIRILETRKNRITEILDKRDLIALNIENNKISISSTKSFNEAHKLLSVQKSNLERCIKVDSILNKRDLLVVNIMKSQLAINKTEQYKDARKLMVSVHEKSERAKKINSVITEREQLIKNIDEKIIIINSTESIKYIQSLFIKLGTIETRKNKVKDIYEKVLEINISKKELLNKIDRVNNIIKNKTNKLEDSTLLFNSMKKIIESSTRISVLLNSRQSLIDNIEKNEEKKAVGYIDAFKLFKKMQLLIERRCSVVSILNDRDLIESNINKNDLKMIELKKTTDFNLNKYKNVLMTAGKCPVCFGTIEKATINRIIEEYTK